MHQLSAIELASLIAARVASAVDVIERFLGRSALGGAWARPEELSRSWRDELSVRAVSELQVMPERLAP